MSPIPKDFKNEAYVLHALDDARLQPYELPRKPGPQEVLLRSLSTGICGSDIHYLKEMRLGNIIITHPIVLGHEASAEVVEVGSEVSHVKPGDLVTYEPSVTCLKCEYCDNKDYNLCEYATSTCPPYTGSLTYYFVHHGKFTFKVPDHVDAEEAALVEPVCVGVHACRRGNITVGDKVFITGSGPIGLIMLICAKAYGATRVVLTDINESRLKLARELGADETILVKKGQTEEELREKVKAAFGGELPNKTFECSGVAVNFRLVMLTTKSAGTCVFVGMGPTDILLPVAEAANREVDIRSCHRYKSSFPAAIELVASGKYPFKKLITHRFDLKDSAKAFDTVVSGAGVKVMIKVAEPSKKH